MRYSICATLAFLIIIVFAFSSYGIDSSSILGIWLLDENKGNVAGDSSGNNRNGEIKGNVKWVKGKFDTALELPGQGDSHVVIPHDDSLSVTTFSVTAWVNLVNRGAYQALVEKGEVQGDVRNFYLAVTPEGLLYGGLKDKTGWNSVLGAVIADENWHHAAVTYDMKKILVYVDGKSYSKLAIGVEGGVEPLVNQAPITFGITNAGGGEPAQGIIDEVGIFNQGLTEADIKAIMDKGLKQTALSIESKSKLTTVWGKIKSF
jgi:hypothetical protein